jgi:hypothetical protein
MLKIGEQIAEAEPGRFKQDSKFLQNSILNLFLFFRFFQNPVLSGFSCKLQSYENTIWAQRFEISEF